MSFVFLYEVFLCLRAKWNNFINRITGDASVRKNKGAIMKPPLRSVGI